MGGSEVSCRTRVPVANYAHSSLVAMPIGPPGHETLVLNVDSLWDGGPFETSVGYLDLLLQAEGKLNVVMRIIPAAIRPRIYLAH